MSALGESHPTQDEHVLSRISKGPPLVSLTRPRMNVSLIKSPKAHQTQHLPLVSLAKPKMNVSLVKSPKAHQTQGPPLVSLAKPRTNASLVKSPKAS